MDTPMQTKTDRRRRLMLGALLAAAGVVTAAPAGTGEPEASDEPASTAPDVGHDSDAPFRPDLGLGLDFEHDFRWSEFDLNLGMLQDEGATIGCLRNGRHIVCTCAALALRSWDGRL